VNLKKQKWVYLFQEGSRNMRDLLGGKGAGLAEMSAANLPVPPGFIITTEACNAYDESKGKFPSYMWDQTINALKQMEVETGKGFGDSSNPLLVSVRSGAKVSMPGMMDTVLNLGLNEITVEGIAFISGNRRFAQDSYRRFIQMFGRIVLNIPGDTFEQILDDCKQRNGLWSDTDLTTVHLEEIVQEFLSLVKERTGKDFPQDPLEQLDLAIKAVFGSWNGKRAIDYRNFYKIPHDLGTAVNVVAMVFGNMGNDSGSGVAFTRDPATGNQILYGEFLPNAQGEDVVAGTRTPASIAEMASSMPNQYRELVEIANRLESHYRDAQDMEFTIERGKLYMLQTRVAKRTAQASIKIAVDMANEGLISKEEALQRVDPLQINNLLLPRFDDVAKKEAIKSNNLLTIGLNASPGAASGKAIFDANRAEALALQGTDIILVRPETNPDDVHGMLHAKGVFTARGGATSHAAVVARGLGKPCVAGAEALKIDLRIRKCTIEGHTINEGDEISIDGSTGEVFLGAIDTIEPIISKEKELNILLGWADEIRRLGVWANADDPVATQRALDFGAEGIGLCRTEHMFFEEDRLPWMRQLILAASEATRLEEELQKLQIDASNTNQSSILKEQLTKQENKVAGSEDVKNFHESLRRFLQFQIQDFKEILGIMTGKPVIIRLLDPPLHEFLPKYEELLVDVTTLRLTGGDPSLLAKQEKLLKMIEEMREQNPMLGLRGCRLGILYSAITQMQARAIFTAACELIKEGRDPQPKIMVPLVAHANELRIVRHELELVAQAVQEEQNVTIHYKIGTMIELPRAALTADEIAPHAQFFSFGTNDLTQTTFGISRDDAEEKFLLKYVEQGILPENPFQVLDRAGVGKLMKTSVDLGRKANPGLEIGICGEHGGDPSSIEFCNNINLDYVSSSPFRVPVARLAAAQAVLTSHQLGLDFTDV